MAPSFVKHKFNVMLGVATITMSVNYLVMLSGSVIVGNLVGADGLGGANVCTPVFGIASFFAALLSVGSGLVFSQAMGAFEDRRASGVFSQSFGLAVLTGLVIALLMFLGGNLYMDFMGVEGAIRSQALAYWHGQTVALALLPLVLLMESMVYADGDGLVAALAGAMHVSGSIGLSALFTARTGSAGGAAFGTACTMALVLLVSSLHFLRRHNHLRFVRYWSARDLRATCAASLSDATIYLCWGVLILFVNKLVVDRFDAALLPIVALAASVVQFSIVFDGVGEALIPLGGMYEGERNLPALRLLARHSACAATLEGALCGLLFAVFAPVLAPLYGIRGDAAPLLPQAVRMMRILACAMPFMGFLMMANTHFLVVRHVAFAVSVTFVKDLVLPALLIVPCMIFWGFDGLWIGFALGYALSSAYPFLFVGLRYGRAYFPWLIPSEQGLILDFSERLAADTLPTVQDRIARFLTLNRVSASLIARVRQVVDETGRASLAQYGETLAEYAVFLNEPGTVRLITRDMGEAFDVSRETPDLAALAERRYLNTLNCNRSEYIFRERP